jgi:hypothetical protein
VHGDSESETSHTSTGIRIRAHPPAGVRATVAYGRRNVSRCPPGWKPASHGGRPDQGIMARGVSAGLEKAVQGSGVAFRRLPAPESAGRDACAEAIRRRLIAGKTKRPAISGGRLIGRSGVSTNRSPEASACGRFFCLSAHGRRPARCPQRVVGQETPCEDRVSPPPLNRLFLSVSRWSYRLQMGGASLRPVSLPLRVLLERHAPKRACRGGGGLSCQVLRGLFADWASRWASLGTVVHGAGGDRGVRATAVRAPAAGANTTSSRTRGTG